MNMREIKINPKGDNKTISNNINNISNQIHIAIKRLNECECFMRDGSIFKQNIYEVLNYWVGNTYVGERKDDLINKAFTNFFNSLLKLLLVLKQSDKEYEEAKALYQGKVYRVLGYYEPCEYHDLIQPEYSDFYVSWSKDENIMDVLINKLYNPITKIEAVIKNNYYGIDLEILGVSKPNEKEVVFPTIEETIRKQTYVGL